MDDPEWELDDYSLRPKEAPAHHGIDEDMLDHQDYALAVTGDVFRWMINNAPLETLQRVRLPTILLDIFLQSFIQIIVLIMAWCRCSLEPKYSHVCHPTKRTKS